MTSAPTDEALSRLLEAGRARAGVIDPEHARLWGALEAATEGGKRFRPALVLATHDALGGTLEAAAAEVGAAVELLHTAFVIHDDVIDGDHLRRGRINVSGTFHDRALAAGAATEEAEGYGCAAAILAGDLALAASVRAIATCGAPTDVVHRLLDLFDGALHTTASGELADVHLALDVPRDAAREPGDGGAEDQRLLVRPAAAGRRRAGRRRRRHDRTPRRGRTACSASPSSSPTT